MTIIKKTTGSKGLLIRLRDTNVDCRTRAEITQVGLMVANQAKPSVMVQVDSLEIRWLALSNAQVPSSQMNKVKSRKW